MENQNFSLETLNQLYEQAPLLQKIVNKKVIEEKDITQASNYVKKYFYPLKSGGSFVWDNDNDVWQFMFYPKETLNDVYLNRFPDEVKVWYNKKYLTLFEMVNDLRLPTLQASKINMCKGFLHKKKNTKNILLRFKKK